MRAKEIEPSKPRNFVAKNAKMGGAGAHKDKKKAQKQGDVKHKGKEIAEGVSYGQMGPELAQKLLAAYKEVSQGVEQYRDQEGAKRIYNELSQVAKENNGGQYLRSLMNSASHSAHMDFDTNPGDFKNWFTYVGDHLESLVNLMKEKGTITDEPDTLPDVEEGYYRRPGSSTAYDRDYASSISGMGKRDSLAYQLDGGANDEGWGKDDNGRYQAPEDRPVLKGYYFYDVPAGKEGEAAIYGVKKTKSGKWAKALYSTSGRSFSFQKQGADKAFGPGKFWAPKK